MVDRSVSFGPITVTFGNVATWCGRMLQPASGAGVQILGYTFSVAGTGWSQVNPALMDLSTDGSGLVAVGTWLQENDSLVVFLQRTVPEPPDAGSSNHDALAVNIVPYALDPDDEGDMVAPCAVGSPSNPTILAHRSSPLWFNTDAVAALPSVIDLDVLTPIAGWPSWANSRPTMAEVLPRWAGYCGELWAGSWGFASRLPSAHHARGGYGHYYSGKVSDGMMMALSTEGTAAERKELARRLAQWGVDIYGAFVLGRNDGVDGGHYQGRKGLVVWAGHFLEKPWVDASAAVGTDKFNEDEQFYTTTPKAWSFTDRTWTAGYKGKSESPTNLLLPVSQWGTHFETMLYLTGYFQPAVGSQVGTALAMQIIGRTAEMGVGHRGMVEQFMDGPGTANLEAIDDIVITCIDPRDGAVFDSGHPRDILWGYSDSPDGHNGFGRAAWMAYSSYAPPATTVVTYDHSAHPSPRYAATVNGAPLPLWGRTTDAHFNTPYWTAGQMVDQSGATLATDGPVEIEVSLVSGSITGATVYTRHPSLGKVIPSTVAGGTLSFTLPADTIAWCEINSLRGQPLIITSRPLIEQPTGPTVDIYDGSQTSATTGRILVFEPGTHTIGQSFEVPAGATVWLHGEAWVVGSFKAVNNAGDHEIGGHGIVSGEWGSALRSYIRTLPFETALTYCLIYGPFVAVADSKVWGITLLDPPFYATSYGFNQYERVTVIGPWWGNANAFFIAQKWPELTGSVHKCVAFVHDDVVDMAEYYGPHTFNDNVFGSIASATFIVSYWPYEDSGTTHVATNNTVVCLNYAIEHGGSIVLAWCDGSHPSEVVDGIVIDGCDFVGSVINGRPFDLRNKQYPAEWNPALQELLLGQIQDFTFRNITFEVVPTFKSKIEGLDVNNHPRRIAFENVWYATTRLTAGNFRDYFDIDEFSTEITVDGVRVDRIVTTGGASVAVGAAGTSGLQIVSVGGASVSISAAGAAALQVGTVGSVTIPIGASGFSTLGVVPPPVADVPMNVPRGPGVRPGKRRLRAWWTWLNPWG